jgi:beta-carotene hydroxylase
MVDPWGVCVANIISGSRDPLRGVVYESEVAAIRRAAPSAGIKRPTIALPTVLIWLGSIVVWAAATAVVLSAANRWWLGVTIPVQAFVTFSMFTVLHDSIHSTVGRRSWVNQLFGRLSMPFVSLFGTFPMLKYIHIAHHRNTNESIDNDPDAWPNVGPRWQVVVRCFTIDAWYACFYFRRLRNRPNKEIAGFLINLSVVAALVIAAVTLWDWGLQFVLIYLIPQRIGMGLLGWLFDWLPHHDLTMTAKENRFQTARVRVGWERLMSPLLFYQNYHVVHHIHPAIPFYALARAWKKREADYLDRNVPINTVWGLALTPSEYREWRGHTNGAESSSAFE